MPETGTDEELLVLYMSHADKAKIMRAAALRHMDVETFILESALHAAEEVIAQEKSAVPNKET